MSKHLTAQVTELYHQHRLPAAELLEADVHLSSCANCREQLREHSQTNAAVEDLRAGLEMEELQEPEHPAYAQFTAYAENRLDDVDREIVDSHLSGCARCAEVMQDLRVFVAAPQPSPVVSSSVTESTSFRERFAWLWRLRTDWMSLQFAAVAASLLLLAGITAAVWFSLKNPSSPAEVARVTPSPTVALSPQLTETPSIVPTPTNEAVASSNSNINAEQGLPQKEQAANVTATPPVDSATVALKDGGQLVTVDERGNVKGLEALSTADRQAVSHALTTEKVEAPSTLASLVGSVSVLRGGASEGISFPILNPVGTVVLTERPMLRWGTLEGASGYVVRVFDRDFKKVAESQPLTETEWTVTTPLARGGVYTWQVTAKRDGQEITSPETPAPEAKFMVLDAAKAEELGRAKLSYRGSHLTLGTLYARAGLLDDAEREFRLLLRDNPGSPAARKLLQSVRALRNPR